MELLVTTPTLTPPIAEALGFSSLPSNQHAALNGKRMNDCAAEYIQLEIEEEEFIDSDQDDKEALLNISNSVHNNSSSNFLNTFAPTISPCWLLLRALNNLLCKHDSKTVPISVRIASLQLLTGISQHFGLITLHLEQVALALQHCLWPTYPLDVRLYAARCLETCAYQMSNHLLDQTIYSMAEVQVIKKRQKLMF